MEAIVLAGGLGTRLRSVVPDLPKPLAPVAGKPFIAWLLQDLSRSGFSRAVLSVGYRHGLIQAAIGASFLGMPISYAVEQSPLGTGGAIRLAARQCGEEDVFVLNGDTHADLDHRTMHASHVAAGASLTICTVDVPDTARFGGVLTDGARVVGFTEKGSAGPGRINAGVYVMKRGLLEGLALPEVFSFEREVLAARLTELRPLAFPARGTFIDIGVPADYERAQQLFADR